MQFTIRYSPLGVPQAVRYFQSREEGLNALECAYLALIAAGWVEAPPYPPEPFQGSRKCLTNGDLVIYLEFDPWT
jgi:hypothetical protein